MTVEEWANEIERQKRLVLDGPKTNYIHLIHSDKELERQIQIDVIRAAIEAEREACAKIVDELKEQLQSDAGRYADSGGVCHASATFGTAAKAMELAGNRIRARS